MLRAKIAKRYQIRRYPDITHSLRAQYPVPDWDVAHALTSKREPINPRPLDEAAIFRALDQYADGFITYSEGCNDDVNKIVWSGWAGTATPTPLEILRQYSRYFIGERYAETFAQGLLGARAQLARAARRERRRRHDAAAVPGDGARRLAARPAELALPAGALSRLLRRATSAAPAARERARSRGDGRARARGRDIGALAAVDAAQAALDRADREPSAPLLRRRVCELAEALFQSIRMQLASSATARSPSAAARRSTASRCR